MGHKMIQQRNSIPSLGTKLGPDVLDAVQTLFDSEQRELAEQIQPAAIDAAYGSDERQKLDIYAPIQATQSPAPVLVFVHGGGFIKGDKGNTQRWQNGAVARMAAAAGLVGVVINYRLAPSHTWPAGGEDVGSALDWVQQNIGRYGGSTQQIFLMGTSAGAVHIATLVKLRGDQLNVKGLILLSGLYGFTPLDDRDTLYYGEQSLYSDRSPKQAIINTKLPLMIASAEFDPLRFQTEFVHLLQTRLERHGVLPQAIVLSGHNHYSMALHLGTKDERLKNEILKFIQDSIDEPTANTRERT